MNRYRSFKLILFAGLLALLLCCCLFFLYMEQAAQRPVGFISPSELESMSPELLIDMSMLRYKGEKAPVDIYTETLYLPCDLSSAQPFKGLSCLDPGCRIYIVSDPAAEDPVQSMADSSSLRLAICRGSKYQLVNLVLTGFPVIDLSISSSFIDERGNAAYRGQFTLSPVDEDDALSSAAQWNVRGNTSTAREKKPWKLELQKLSGKDMEMALLGLGTDSDWILNPMVFDDLKLREKFAMELWNSLLYPDYEAHKMSRGEYVEIIFDGQYSGLYMLQKQVDQSYLGFDPNRNLLFKHSRMDEELSLRENYELVWSPYDSDTSYALLQQALDEPAGRDLDSLLNMNLFLDFLSANDNARYKNMFFILSLDEEQSKISYLPWDTDLSLGMLWSDDRGITLDYEAALAERIIHREFAAMTQSYPGLELEQAKLWQEQRQSVYKEETIFSILDAIRRELDASGALIRDLSTWEELYRWDDSFDMLCDHITARLSLMDEHYAGITE